MHKLKLGLDANYLNNFMTSTLPTATKDFGYTSQNIVFMPILSGRLGVTINGD